MSELLYDHWPLLAVLGVVAALLLAARLLLRDTQPPYQKRDALLGADQRRLYAALREAAGDRWVVLSMVRLADLIQVLPGAAKRQAWQNRINARHVDFVVCDPTTFEPQLVVELDRRRRKREAHSDRELFLQRALASAGLPVLGAKAESVSAADLGRLMEEQSERKAA
jgi:very-short-patch-repair endonuclease